MSGLILILVLFLGVAFLIVLVGRAIFNSSVNSALDNSWNVNEFEEPSEEEDDLSS